MNIRFFATIIISACGMFVLLEYRTLWNNGSLVVANISHQIGYYQGDENWVARLNEALWLADDHRYSEAKARLAPILSDLKNPKQAEIRELYGDLIYMSSGSLDDAIRMYELSLEINPNTRISEKIAYLKQQNTPKTGTVTASASQTNTGQTNSGANMRESKKQELQKISANRGEYLSNNTVSTSEYRHELQRLFEQTQSGSSDDIQDW